jgi:protoporphyrinogen oxidase
VAYDVLIIGAGPAGLTAGYLLSKRGKRVVVLEQDPASVGGISRTVEHQGFLFDIGGHRFFSKASAVVELWNEILPDDFLHRPRLSRIYYGGKFYSYPLRAFEALRNLGLLTSAACILSYAWAKFRPIASPRTFHEWVRNQFGERLYAIFFRTYTEKVWGMSCDEISADWAAQRIKGLSLGAAVWNGVLRSINRQRSDGRIKTLIENFRYPRRGPGMLWQEAARKMVQAGGELRLGQRVARLVFDGAAGLWSVTAERPDGSMQQYQAHHVISSAPMREAARMLEPALESRAAAEKLRYRDFLIVALVVKARELFPDNWIYIHDPSVKVGRVQNFRSWSPEMVPDPELSCLGLEYFCFEGDGLWSMSDADLVALATREIGQIGIVAGADVLEGVVVRQAKAYPVYDEDYRKNVDVVRREIEARFPSLHLVGRNGMHKYNNQDHAMMTAMLTVENIMSGSRSFDVWKVNEDAEYHEDGEDDASEALKSIRLVPEKIA